MWELRVHNTRCNRELFQEELQSIATVNTVYKNQCLATNESVKTKYKMLPWKSNKWLKTANEEEVTSTLRTLSYLNFIRE